MSVFSFIAWCLLVATRVEVVAGQCSQRSYDNPNVLHIILDQLRYDCIRFIQDRMPEYDNYKKIETPNMDRLFERSAVFENAYCVSPVCTPSRAVLKSGSVLQRAGAAANQLMHRKVYTLMKSFEERVESVVTYEHQLKKFGYQVEAYGKWHVPLIWNYDAQGNQAIDHDYYDFENDEFGLMPSQLFIDKYKAFAPYLIERDGQEVDFDLQYDEENKYTGYPYEPIYHQYGRDILKRNYTYTALQGRMASKALDRLIQSDQPFIITVNFLAPHKPWIVNDHHLSMYYPHRRSLHSPKSENEDLSNSAYGHRSNKSHKQLTRSKRLKAQAIYYALISEVDDWVGVLLDQVDDAGLTNCTLISLTSDHGEMMGAHTHMGKGQFYRDSINIPWALSLPGVIPAKIVSEDVSQIDAVATIMDYVGAQHLDVSDGKSLRRYLEYEGINHLREECAIVSETEKRYPISRSDVYKVMGLEPGFMIVHRGWKLMIPKLATANIVDMMFNLDDDPEEMKNLIGLNGRTASRAVIGKAEHLRALLVEYLREHDGPDKVYSDPGFYLNVTQGDIQEVLNRREWRNIWLWMSETKILKFGKPYYSANGDKYMRNEYLYLGRTSRGRTNITDINIVGPNKDLFSVSKTNFVLEQGMKTRVKVQYKNDEDIDPGTVKARLQVEVEGRRPIKVELRVFDQICP